MVFKMEFLRFRVFLRNPNPEIFLCPWENPSHLFLENSTERSVPAKNYRWHPKTSSTYPTELFLPAPAPRANVSTRKFCSPIFSSTKENPSWYGLAARAMTGAIYIWNRQRFLLRNVYGNQIPINHFEIQISVTKIRRIQLLTWRIGWREKMTNAAKQFKPITDTTNRNTRSAHWRLINWSVSFCI